MMMTINRHLPALLVACGLFLLGCGDDAQRGAPQSENGRDTGRTLLIYSGRNKSLVGPLLKKYQDAEGVTIKVKYAKTAQLAALILEEGDKSPADVFFAQDAGALGTLAQAGRLQKLPAKLLSRVDRRYRSAESQWVGVTGRVRTVVYSTRRVKVEELPKDLFGFTSPRWQGRVGWAPSNASFHAMITAMREVHGDERTGRWLRAMKANGAIVYPKNTPIVQAVADGEIDAGFVNHYYLMRFSTERGDDFPARNYFLPGGSPGSMVNVAGAGVVSTSDNQQAARRFIAFLLSRQAQEYFSTRTHEYPLALAGGVQVNQQLPPLTEIEHPSLDLGRLSDLQGTLKLLREAGVLP